MTEYKRGTVALVLFPNSDLLTAKRRPAVVVQADTLNTGKWKRVSKACGSQIPLKSVRFLCQKAENYSEVTLKKTYEDSKL